ncbi:hypothetical protein M9978_12375 [Sphingomonas sp. MG17]|uniref:Uncharacterized protein n=1 Tax=Sphingomonas tagetis TaxID=2949092 RepID=A0A9X2HPN8_9SPHN|nr:hypothetical protein [Sphingomonas tagetis]MCP3731223.1 hypothetical protein [Sphingomonas tagetis]
MPDDPVAPRRLPALHRQLHRQSVVERQIRREADHVTRRVGIDSRLVNVFRECVDVGHYALRALRSLIVFKNHDSANDF